MALSKDRETQRRAGEVFEFTSKSGEVHYLGSIVMLDSNGEAVAATAATGLLMAGCCMEYCDNTSDGERVKVEQGCFKWKNSGTNAITAAHIGDICYAEDDETVGSLATGMSAVGIVRQVDTDGVWVEAQTTIVSGLAAANNLSEVTAATARTNLGVAGYARKFPVYWSEVDLVGANARRYFWVSPVAGTIDKMQTVLQKAALTTGDATVTLKINGTAVTDGAATITQSGSAIGDVDVATPSALKTVAIDDKVEILIGGTNDAAATANVQLEITLS